MFQRTAVVLTILLLIITMMPSMAEEAEDLVIKGITEAKAKKYLEAIDYFDKAIELSPDNLMAWYYKGTSMEELVNYPKAIECFDRVIEINPSYSDAWYHKGNCHLKLEEYDKALFSYDKALELNPSHSKAAEKREEAIKLAPPVPGETDDNAILGQTDSVPDENDNAPGGEIENAEETGFTWNREGTLFCASGEKSAIACIDGKNNTKTGSLKVKDPVVNLFLTPDGKELWCISADIMGDFCSNFPVTVIDPDTGEVIDTVDCPGAGTIAFTPDGKKAYISVPQGEEVLIYDVKSRKEINRIKTGRHPYDIKISFDGSRVYIGHGCVVTGDMTELQNIISQFENMDPEDMSQIDMSQLENLQSPVETGSDFIVVVDCKSDEVIDKIYPGGWSSSLAVSPDGSLLYATVCSLNTAEGSSNNSSGFDGVAVIDTKNLSVIKEVTFNVCSKSPSNIAFTPDGKKVYAIFGTDDAAFPINVSTHKAGTLINLGLGG